MVSIHELHDLFSMSFLMARLTPFFNSALPNSVATNTMESVEAEGMLYKLQLNTV